MRTITGYTISEVVKLRLEKRRDAFTNTAKQTYQWASQIEKPTRQLEKTQTTNKRKGN